MAYAHGNHLRCISGTQLFCSLLHAEVGFIFFFMRRMKQLINSKGGRVRGNRTQHTKRDMDFVHLQV